MNDHCWVDSLRRWHEARLRELDYPREVVNRLTHDREQWLGSSGAVCCAERRQDQPGEKHEG